MGLKCSFLGHQFEEPGLVNEREERGDDVIDIKRRVMVCSICGERRVLAERKEVTKQARDGKEYDEDEAEIDDTASETIDDPDPEADDPEQTEDATGIDSIDSEASGFAGVDVVDSGSSETTGSPSEERRDDGVILSGNDTTSHSVSDWSTGSDDRRGDSWHPATKSPSHRRADQEPSNSITAATDDGEILASATGESSGRTESDAASRTPAGTTQEEESTTDTQQNSSEFEEEMITCSMCEFSVIAANSPFRTGDICPQCHDAYLTDRASSCHRSTE